MDFLMDLRWVYCLQNGLPMDMDVYDLATWCSIAEFSEISFRERRYVEVPDFTRGGWRTAALLDIVSVASLRGRMPEVGPKGLAYFCHTVFSKDASRVFWLARGIDWYDPVKEKAGPWSTTAFTCRSDGSEVRRCFPDNWGGSHFNWRDDRTMAVTVYPKEHANGAWHVTFSVGEEEKVHRLAPGLLDWDGHCVWSPNGRWISTEGYFDKTFHRHWALVRTADEAVVPVGSFFVPEAYRGGFWRCDLHGRWRPDGRQIGFNSVHEGSRQVYVMDIEE